MKISIKIEEIDSPTHGYWRTGEKIPDHPKYYRVTSSHFPIWHNMMNELIYACEGYPKEEVVENFINHAKMWIGGEELTKKRQSEIETREVDI